MTAKTKANDMFYRPGRERVRATFSAATLGPAGRVERVDEENGILRGVQIVVEGEAIGHDVWLDAEFIRAVAAQGAALKTGLKVRFGHPAMCADALGTYLGRATNFRTVEITRPDGTPALACLADVAIADEAAHAPQGDLRRWVIEAAKNSPDSFGQSIVFTYADVFILDKDGGAILWSGWEGTRADWLEFSDDGRVYAVLGKLLGADFTDEPAATDGVFSAESLAAEAASYLDAHPGIVRALAEDPDRVRQFADRYNAALAETGRPPIVLAGASDARDAEIRLDALRTEKDARISELSSALAAAGEKISALESETESLRRESAAAAESLSEAQSALAETRASLAEAQTALAETRAALAEEEGRRARLVGAALRPAPSAEDYEARLARAASPEERMQIRIERDRALAVRGLRA